MPRTIKSNKVSSRIDPHKILMEIEKFKQMLKVVQTFLAKI